MCVSFRPEFSPVKVVLIDAYCTCVDIDATAANVETPEAFTLVSRICLVMYTLELTAFLGAFGLKPLCKDWMMLGCC